MRTRKLTKYSQLRHGMKVRGKVNGEAKEGIVTINECGAALFVWSISDAHCFAEYNEDIADWENVTDLVALQPVLEGDVIVDPTDGRFLVLAVQGKVFLRSGWNESESLGGWLTLEYLPNRWKIKDEDTEPTKTIVTLKEIAEWKGVPVDSLEVEGVK